MLDKRAFVGSGTGRGRGSFGVSLGLRHCSGRGGFVQLTRDSSRHGGPRDANVRIIGGMHATKFKFKIKSLTRPI